MGIAYWRVVVILGLIRQLLWSKIHFYWSSIKSNVAKDVSHWAFVS